MSCRKITSLLPLYSVDGLNARDRARVEAHLADCAECQAELAALTRATTLVERLPAPEPPRDLWAGVAAATVQRPAPRVAWWLPAVAALSLALLLVGGWLLVAHPALAPGNAFAQAYAAEYHQVTAQPDAGVPLSDAEVQAGFRWMAPTWLPAGYALTATRAARCPCGCGDRTIQAIYRNGDRVFLLAEKKGMNDQACRAGACTTCRVDRTPVVTRALPDRDIIAVGDIAPDVLRHVATSIQP